MKMPIHNPPPHLSASSIGTFNQCPLKFKFSKIDGITDDPTEATLMGNFVHDIMEEFYRHDPELRDIALARTLASKIWEEKWRDEVTPWVKGDKQLHMFRWNSWWCVENLWKLEDPMSISPTGLEREVNGLVGGVKIKGFIDRFVVNNGKITISDYKTGKVPKPQYAGEKFFQLNLYAHLLRSEGVGEPEEVQRGESDDYRRRFCSDGRRRGEKSPLAQPKNNPDGARKLGQVEDRPYLFGRKPGRAD